MKRLIKLYSIVLCSWFVWGCYDDKGNYDYSDLGEVLLKIDAEETVMYGETLEMSPEITPEKNDGRRIRLGLGCRLQDK